MPATESTYRNTQLMHRIFAITGVLLTIGTVWMFWKDHARSWKTYQVEINDVDLKMAELRKQQYQTVDARLEHDRRARELAAAKAQAIDPAALDEFESHAKTLDHDVLDKWRKAGHPYSLVSFDEKYITTTAQKLDKLATEAEQKRADADQAEQAVDKALADAKTTRAELDKLEAQAREANRAAKTADDEAAR